MLVVGRGTADQDGGMIPLRAVAEVVEENPLVSMEFHPGLNHYTLVLGEGAASVASAIADRATDVSPASGH
jgi:hypothetical protein